MRRLTSNALPGIMLVIIIFWALFAVLLLTGILSTANRIESRVGVINSEVTPINNKLDVVPVLANVQDTANQIRDAAAPLTGIIGNVVTSASSIDTTAKQILGSAESINKSAKSIDAQVIEINPTVKSILSSITSIDASANEIHDSVVTIGGSFIGVVDDVYDIKSRIVLASVQVDAAIRYVQGIDLDTTSILDRVIKIVGNSDRILTKSPLILNSANAGVMREMIAASARQGPGHQAGLPAFDLLPQIPQLGLPTLPALPTRQLPLDLSKLLQGLPVLGDTGDLLGLVGTTPK
ncbi:MAG TPA: methyl-accepting chemotaxis protein [Pseudonocardiaceae bacterium]|jgi:hypothetical protein|nr:methyl-accepting chemotaxis protein [Pseudonocardiaceae bacterium]